MKYNFKKTDFVDLSVWDFIKNCMKSLYRVGNPKSDYYTGRKKTKRNRKRGKKG